MFRPALAGVLAAGLVASATLSGTAQDTKKADPPKKVDPPKKAAPKPPAKPRIAIADPVKAKEDPDFAVQGEYAGEAGGKKFGAQVVAKGLGDFTVRVLAGGLPGEGWDGKTQTTGTAKRGDDGTATITGDVKGTIAGGKLTVAEGTLDRVERKSPTLGAKPPAGAVVLFGGPGTETAWKGGKVVALPDGTFLGNGITSNQAFGAFTAHVEFRTPWMPNSSGQQRGNSGFYMQNRYELQVLDSFGLKGENNEAGGIYTLHKPLVNMCLPPLTWQTYDIEFTPAQFDAAGKKTKAARATVVHNGVKVQDDVELKGPTGGGQPEAPTPGPIQLQNHGDPVVFNNVWVVEKK